MKQILQAILKSIVYGLAVAFLWLLVFQPEGQFNFRNVLGGSAAENMPISYAKAVRAAAPAVVNIYTRSTQVDVQSYQQRVIQNQSWLRLTP